MFRYFVSYIVKSKMVVYIIIFMDYLFYLVNWIYVMNRYLVNCVIKSKIFVYVNMYMLRY